MPQPPASSDGPAIGVTRPECTFAVDGFEIRPAVLNSKELLAIQSEISLDHEVLRRTGIRDLEKKFRSIAQTAAQPSVLSIATSVLGKAPRLVRALFFDKTPDRNWFVAWHQDRTVALNRRVDLHGWRSWTKKDGVHHAEPPREVLDHMVTIRLHVDAADQNAGCLSVIPGSHRLGVLATKDVMRVANGSIAHACIVNAGDAVIMHPLIVHSSAKSRSPAHRRVVHLEFSDYELPPGVAWA